MGSNQNHSLAGKLIILCLWIFGGAMLLWNVLRIWPGEQFWPVAMVNYFSLAAKGTLLKWLSVARFGSYRYSLYSILHTISDFFEH
jgi:hypothetical protein